MSTTLDQCGTTPDTLYPTPDNCWEQVGTNIVVHYKGEDYTHAILGDATVAMVQAQDCPDLYATCNTTSIVWAYPPSAPVQTPLAQTGVDPVLVVALVVSAIIASGVGSWLLAAGGKRRNKGE
ncbi:membrane protein [Microbacterium phage Birdfeeder]|nr:membrane protein [Microbacterium phage Birdfeeder]